MCSREQLTHARHWQLPHLLPLPCLLPRHSPLQECEIPIMIIECCSQEKTFVRWDERGCTTEASCKTVCDAMATCWGFIHVPAKGFAIRGGEMQVGVRTFVASPEPVAAAAAGLNMSSLKW